MTVRKNLAASVKARLLAPARSRGKTFNDLLTRYCIERLGMGVSCVPIRALALYARKRNIRLIAWPTRFTRELVVVVRRNREIPEHVGQFIQNVLF